MARLLVFSLFFVFLGFGSEVRGMFNHVELVSHINTNCGKELAECARLSALSGDQLLQEFQNKSVIFSKTTSDFRYPNGDTAIAAFDRAMTKVVANPIGKELITVLLTKLMRRREVWNTIASETKLRKESVVQAVNGYKRTPDPSYLTALEGELSRACDLVRCVLSPENPDDVADRRVVPAAIVDFRDFYDASSNLVKFDAVGGRLHSVYSTSKNSNVNGKKIEQEVAVISRPAFTNRYFGLFQAKQGITQVVRVVLEMLGVFLDVSCKAMEYDSTLEIMNFHKCCFFSATGERDSVRLNFSDYNPITLESSGTYSMMSYWFSNVSNLFSQEKVSLTQVNRSLVDVIFHECTHFLHAVEGKRLVGTVGLEILFGVRSPGGGYISGVGDILERMEMVKRWTKDEELVTILGIKFEGGIAFFDRLSNAGFMYNLLLARIWHMVIIPPAFVSDMEEDRMEEVLRVISENV